MKKIAGILGEKTAIVKRISGIQTNSSIIGPCIKYG
jgi:hypothetical protein